MKNLLWIVGGFFLIVLFADGGFTFAPDLSPALDAQLNVDYSSTKIEEQTLIDTNIEHQTVIVQAPPAAVAPGGVHLVDVGPGRCAAQPGDVIEQEQGNGACFVWNGNRKYFINPNGNRWEVDATGEQPPLSNAATSSTTVVTTTVLLSPDVPRTMLEMQAAFLRNGGELPWFWNLRSDDDKTRWLSQQEATWRK